MATLRLPSSSVEVVVILSKTQTTGPWYVCRSVDDAFGFPNWEHASATFTVAEIQKTKPVQEWRRAGWRVLDAINEFRLLNSSAVHEPPPIMDTDLTPFYESLSSPWSYDRKSILQKEISGVISFQMPCFTHTISRFVWFIKVGRNSLKCPEKISLMFGFIHSKWTPNLKALVSVFENFGKRQAKIPVNPTLMNMLFIFYEKLSFKRFQTRIFRIVFCALVRL